MGDNVVQVPHALKSAAVEYVARYEYPGQIRVWATPSQPRGREESKGDRMTDGIDLDPLEALAANATPGPWAAYELPQPVGITHATIHSPHGPYATTWDARLDPEIAGTLTIPDAEFIAALDPSTVLTLIKRVKTAEAERDALAAKIEQVRALASANNRLRDSENACMLYAPSILAILDQNKEGTRE